MKKFIASVSAGKSLLTPTNHTLVMIDHQPQMAFATRSIDVAELRNNCSIISKTASAFKVSTIITAIARTSFSGPLFPEIKEVFGDKHVIDRTSMNCWEDTNVINEVNRIGKPRLVLAGLWTSVCISCPVLSAIDEGYEVYVITDACGDVSTEAHEMGMHRMIQAGARPITSIMYLLELQRDWARLDTYDLVMEIAMAHAGGYGLGIDYAKAMFSAKEDAGRTEESARPH